MDGQIYVVYPQIDKMTEAEIINIAKRFYENDDTDIEPTDFKNAVEILAEQGYTTVKTYLQ